MLYTVYVYILFLCAKFSSVNVFLCFITNLLDVASGIACLGGDPATHECLHLTTKQAESAYSMYPGSVTSWSMWRMVRTHSLEISSTKS